MAHPQKPPYRHKNLIRKPSYSPFCPKFHCHGNQGGAGVKLNNTIKLAIPENHTLEPKIMTLSYTQPKFSYDCLKNCLIFPIGAIVIFLIFANKYVKY